MSTRRHQFFTTTSLTALAALAALAALTGLAACGGDSTAKVDDAPPAGAAVSADAFRKQQEHFADSVINATSTAKDVVNKLGKTYAVGSTRLRDSLALLTAKTDCYAHGRQSDPYLAGTISYFVFMSVVGSNVVRVQEGQWTSAAGNIVVSCLNLAAKDWRFDATFGTPASYITQVQLKPETAKPEALRAEPAKAEPAKAEPAKAGAPKPTKKP